MVESDHKPLETIFSKPLASAPRWLQKILMRLQRYDLVIQYKKGKEMYLADTLSHHYLGAEDSGTTAKVSHICSKLEQELETDEGLDEINQLLAQEAQVNEYHVATDSDETLQAVKIIIKKGWPDEKSRLPPVTAPYYHLRDELLTQDGLIFRGDRLIVPKSLRRQTIKELHASHQGVEATLRRARETLYWPNMKNEIKDHISRCDVCLWFVPKQPKETLISHAIPNRLWVKVATDLFKYKQKSYLVTVDYFSNFFEIDRLYDTRTKAAILKLKAHMARYGIPDEFQLGSNQGLQFRSNEFHSFAENYGFKHTLTSPYHHQSNGMAESAVKRAKKVVRVAEATKRDLYLILLDYRNTPQEGLDTSPAQRPMNRRTKTTMPTSSKLLDPEVVPGVHEKIRRRYLTVTV